MIRRYIYGWVVFYECFIAQRRKKHGAKKMPLRPAIFFARCARWIATEQHRPKANPYYRLCQNREGE